MRWPLLFVPLALLLPACGQEIVVVGCDGHTDGEDAGLADSGGGGQPDAPPGADAIAAPDAAPGQDAAPDGGEPDGGNGDRCPGSVPYCITQLMASVASANVREEVVLTPVLSNPSALPLTFRVDLAEIRLERRAGLPAAERAEINFSATADAAGEVRFNVSEVPAFFATTRFTVRLRARSGAMAEVWAEATVAVRGNVLFSGFDAVYAVASDGRPARSGLGSGRLIYGSVYVSNPDSMLLARDGTLLVFDNSASPQRLRQFALTAENSQLRDFEHSDTNQMPYIYPGADSTGIAQLDDGRIAIAVYDFSRPGSDSAILLWSEGGAYQRTLEAANPNARWQALGRSTIADELLVAEYGGMGRLLRVNPNNGDILGNHTDGLVGARGVLGFAGGYAYVGGEGQVLRVNPAASGGGKTMVSMLTSGSSDYWWALAPYADGQIIAARDVGHEYQSIVVIDGTRFVRYLRLMGVGGPTVTPSGLVYLD